MKGQIKEDDRSFITILKLKKNTCIITMHLLLLRKYLAFCIKGKQAGFCLLEFRDTDIDGMEDGEMEMQTANLQYKPLLLLN